MKVKPDIFTLLRTGHFYVALTWKLTAFDIFCAEEYMKLKKEKEVNKNEKT
jgi:hypothetical protein